MPKKTKQSKLAAQERKRKLLHRNFSPVSPRSKVVERAPDKSLSPEDMTLINHFTHDLKKSLLIIACIIALEIVIYFGTINTYLG